MTRAPATRSRGFCALCRPPCPCPQPCPCATHIFRAPHHQVTSVTPTLQSLRVRREGPGGAGFGVLRDEAGSIATPAPSSGEQNPLSCALCALTGICKLSGHLGRLPDARKLTLPRSSRLCHARARLRPLFRSSELRVSPRPLLQPARLPPGSGRAQTTFCFTRLCRSTCAFSWVA